MAFTGPFPQINQAAAIAAERAVGEFIIPKHCFFTGRAGQFQTAQVSFLIDSRHKYNYCAEVVSS